MTTADKISIGLSAVGTIATLVWVYQQNQTQKATAAAAAAAPNTPQNAAVKATQMRVMARNATGLGV